MAAGRGFVNREWYSRGYLPHFDQPGLLQGVTFRLWDSLPKHAVAEMFEYPPGSPLNVQRREELLNTGYGACFLADPVVAALVEEALLYFDGQRYRLLAWVIMPNHVHVLIETQESHPLYRIVHSWKSYTAVMANRLLGREGPFWFREYFDRFVRNERHLTNVIRYIHDNPVKAGLVFEAREWCFSSARLYEEG